MNYSTIFKIVFFCYLEIYHNNSILNHISLLYFSALGFSAFFILEENDDLNMLREFNYYLKNMINIFLVIYFVKILVS